ncbi:MAG: hypothetical protein DWH84_01800 [Planctomycetota bacterium]|nr:MAG: hypothetical protein DWH84_01800 [Planctomycetota bacterium]
MDSLQFNGGLTRLIWQTPFHGGGILSAVFDGNHAVPCEYSFTINRVLGHFAKIADCDGWMNAEDSGKRVFPPCIFERVFGLDPC